MFHPKFVDNILGFNEKAQKLICKDFGGTNHDPIFKFVENHPDISCYCFVLVKCILVSSLFSCKFSQLGKTNRFLRKTVIAIMNVVLCTYMFADSFKKWKLIKFKVSLLRKLDKLAKEAFSEYKNAFGEHDFNEDDFTPEEFAFFITAPGENNPTFFIACSPRRTHFLYFIRQELLCAIHIFQSVSHILLVAYEVYRAADMKSPQDFNLDFVMPLFMETF